MPELLKCIECGKPVSSNAWSCPHCGIREFTGVECHYCRKISKISELSVKEKQGYDSLILDYYYHSSCLKSIRDDGRVAEEPKIEKGSCSVCGYSYVVKPTDYRSSSEWGYYYAVRCSNCGQGVSSKPDMTKISVCLVCNHDVATEKAVCIDYLGEKCYLHSVCNSQKSLENIRLKNESYYADIKQKKDFTDMMSKEKLDDNYSFDFIINLKNSELLWKISAGLVVVSLIIQVKILFFIGVSGLILNFIMDFF